jgi:hypothetical protein
MKQIYSVYSVCILLLWVQEINTQISFTNKTKPYKSNFPTRSVMPGASTDINGDLIDDIIIMDKGNTLKTMISAGKNFELFPKDNIKTTPLREWTLTAGDLDNDGNMEFITAGEYNQGSIVEINSGTPQRKSIFTNIYAQGSNTVDINNDGWLDYFVCDDDGPNKIYINDKTGNIKETPVINFMLNDKTDGSGNYGSEWVDINGDFLPDLILSKCRAGVEDPKDSRRINRVYINNGNGTFDEKGAEFNLNSGAQSWVTVIGDYDNDGDQDALVINHYSPHELMENNNNKTFVLKNLSTPLASFSFQAVSIDFDNDGWLDILLAGVEGAILLHNKGNMNFTIIKNIIGPAQVRSCSVGDYNDDGFTDIFAHLGNPINEVGNVDDQVWLNNGNDNNYVKINLSGTKSNKSSIGAHLTSYSKEKTQVKYIKGGESYGIFNSLTQIIGLGSETKVDSLIIRWPSGTIDKYFDLEHNSTYLAQEGKCISKQIVIYEDPVIYKNEILMVTAPEGYNAYLWNNGLSTASIPVNKGLYHVSMTDSQGCVVISKPINVVSGCFAPGTDLIEEKDKIAICHDQSYEIVPKRAAEFLWQDNSNLPTFTANKTGWVVLKATDFCQNVLEDSIFVKMYDPITVITKGDTIAQNKPATLTSNDEETFWFETSDLEIPIFKGDTLITEPLDTSTTYWAKIIKLVDFKSNNIGLKSFPTTNLYHTNTASGVLFFEISQPIILKSFKISTDIAGVRSIVIKNDLSEDVFIANVFCNIGINTIVLDAALPPGNYTIGTDEDINLQNLGYRSPRFVRTSGNITYPYTIDGVCNILSSSFGVSVYLYFYDWVVESDLVYCESDTKEVLAKVEKENANVEISKNNVLLYPNPTQNIIHIKSEFQFDYGYLTDINGNRLADIGTHYRELNLINYQDGMYILHFFKDYMSFAFKIFKLE